MNPRFWSTLGLLGVLGIVPAFAGEMEAPELDPSMGTVGVKIKTIGPTPISIRPLATAVFFVNTDSDTSLVLKREVLVSDFNDKN